MGAEVKSVIHLTKKYFWLDLFLPAPTSLQTLKHMHWIYISMQITENIKAYYRTFPGNPLHERITQYHPIGFKYYHLQPYLLLPSWASGITTFSLTSYYP